MKNSEIGGQAVLEGVMMKNKNEYAVAVRKPYGEIVVKKEPFKSLRDQNKIADLPIIRGVVTFVESLKTGMTTLNYSTSFYEEQEEKKEQTEEEKKKESAKESLVMGLLMVVAVVLAIGIFVVVPFLISEALKRPIPSPQLRGLLEGVLRVILFVSYVKLITMMNDIKRVFMYHGAEHKCINCIEQGEELTVENVRKQTTVHKRCGTSFLLIVMFVSILFFMFIVVGNMWLRMALRVLLIPVIAGLAYEFIRFAGGHDNKIVNVISKPGLMLQSLTTAEPDDDMIEVAIASVEAVFDWKEFIAHIDDEDTEEEVQESSKEVVDEDAEETNEVETDEEDTDVDEIDEEISVDDIEIVELDEKDEDDELREKLDQYFEDEKE